MKPERIQQLADDFSKHLRLRIRMETSLERDVVEAVVKYATETFVDTSALAEQDSKPDARQSIYSRDTLEPDGPVMPKPEAQPEVAAEEWTDETVRQLCNGHTYTDAKDAHNAVVQQLRQRMTKMTAEMKHANDQWAKLHELLSTSPDSDYDNAPFEAIEQLRQRNAELEAGAAEMREALQELVAEDELLPEIERAGSLPKAKRALSTDCGKATLAELARLRENVRVMRQALETARKWLRFHQRYTSGEKTNADCKGFEDTFEEVAAAHAATADKQEGR